jgi:hypothetical protein
LTLIAEANRSYNSRKRLNKPLALIIFGLTCFIISLITQAVHGQNETNQTIPCPGSPGYHIVSKYGCCLIGSIGINGLCYDKKALAYRNANGTSSLLSLLLGGHPQNDTLLKQILQQDKLNTQLLNKILAALGVK